MLSTKEVWKYLRNRAIDRFPGQSPTFIGNESYRLKSGIHYLCYFNIGDATFAEALVLPVMAGADDYEGRVH